MLDHQHGVGRIIDLDFIDAGESGQGFGPLSFRKAWPSRTFVHMAVGGDADDQPITQLAGFNQMAYMAKVQKVEATVRKHDFGGRVHDVSVG
jgi:hypothetical protein